MAENGSVGTAARDLVDGASSLGRVAVAEVKQKTTALGIGVGLGAGAVALAVFAIGFGLATVTAALATFLPTWLALLLVTLLLMLGAVALGLLARHQLRKGTSPVPDRLLHGAERERLTDALAELRMEAAALTTRARRAALAGLVLSGGIRASRLFRARRGQRRRG